MLGKAWFVSHSSAYRYSQSEYILILAKDSLGFGSLLDTELDSASTLFTDSTILL